MARHGPHHSAQKSTNTGVADWSTLASKSPSLKVCTYSEAIVDLCPLSEFSVVASRRDERRSDGRVAARPSIHFDIFPRRRVPGVVHGHPLTNQTQPCCAILVHAKRLPHGSHERLGRRLAEL